MPTLRSGFSTSKSLIDSVEDLHLDSLFSAYVTSASSKMAANRHTAFREEYDAAMQDAELIFPGEDEVARREAYIKAKTDELLKKHGFLSAVQGDETMQSSRIVKNFVDSCKQYDPKNENMADFFERLERKFENDKISVENTINILDILLPTHQLIFIYHMKKTNLQKNNTRPTKSEHLSNLNARLLIFFTKLSIALSKVKKLLNKSFLSVST